MTKKYIFWTSGWDSTFRLLQLLIFEEQIIQPIYILDENRKSYKNELEAIQLIIEKINQNYPKESKKIMPLILVKKNEIILDSEINQSFESIKKKVKIGSQYEWLSAYCKQNDIKKVELCIEKDAINTSLFNFINTYLKPNHSSESSNDENKFAVLNLFKYFEFPLFEIDKKTMYSISKENNWLDIMNLTWFCHKPKKNKPCGKCNPCKTTIIKGLGFRIKFKNRINGYLHIYLFDQLKKLRR